MIVSFILLVVGGNFSESIFDFLRIPITARYGGLQCSMGMINDKFALFCNPAYMNKEGIGISYVNYLLDIQLGNVVYTREYKKGILGIGLTYLNCGKFIKTTKKEEEIGEFGVHGVAPVVGYSTKIDRISVGGGFKFVYQNIEKYTGMAALLDISCIYLPKGWKNFTIGIVAQNIGMRVKKFKTMYEHLPYTIRIGGNYCVDKDSTLFLSVECRVVEKGISIGGEWEVTSNFTLRGGYYSWGEDLRTFDEADFLAGKSFGMTIKVKKIELDYAFTPKVELGMVHRFSITYPLKWRKEIKEEKEEEKQPEKEGELK
jgi:hypothetical protein